MLQPADFLMRIVNFVSLRTQAPQNPVERFCVSCQQSVRPASAGHDRERELLRSPSARALVCCRNWLLALVALRACLQAPVEMTTAASLAALSDSGADLVTFLGRVHAQATAQSQDASFEYEEPALGLAGALYLPQGAGEGHQQGAGLRPPHAALRHCAACCRHLRGGRRLQARRSGLH